MVITKEQIDRALSIFEDSLKKADGLQGKITDIGATIAKKIGYLKY